MPKVLSPRNLVSRPDDMDETVLSSYVHMMHIQEYPLVREGNIFFGIDLYKCLTIYFK